MTRGLTVEQVLELPAAVTLTEAAAALGIGRTVAHELARAGQFPTPLITIGKRYRVRRSDLLGLLGIEES